MTYLSLRKPEYHFTNVLGAPFSVQKETSLGTNLPPKLFNETAPRSPNMTRRNQTIC